MVAGAKINTQVLGERITALEKSASRKEAPEIRRLNTNEVIRRVNQFRANLAEKLSQDPITAARRSQIARPRPNIAVREPGSPVLPHTDLGELPIYRTQPSVNQTLSIYVRSAAETISSDPKTVRLALELASILPKHALYGPQSSIPSCIRDPYLVARGVREMTLLLIRLQSGELIPASLSDLGRPAPWATRQQAIKQYLEYSLAASLLIEMQNPNWSEREFKGHIARFSIGIKRAARWPGEHGFEEFRTVINSLNDIPLIMLVSRLSNNLLYDLGFPGGLLASEQRLAEAMVAASYRRNFRGYLMEEIADRLESEDINPAELLRQIASLDYGYTVMRNLTKKSGDQGRETIKRLLIAGGHSSGDALFAPLYRFLALNT